jgi:hypothetical protein
MIIHPIRGLVIGVIPHQGFLYSKDPGATEMFENSVFEIPLASEDYTKKFPTNAETQPSHFIETSHSNLRDIWMNNPEIIKQVGAERLIWVANERPI